MGEGRSIHRDQDGVMSIFSVFAVLALTMLLGMVMNVGRQVDGKMRMQNAADAAAYSGTMELTRAMNTLSCTNRLLCEVFSMTAILREGRDQNEKQYVPTIMAAWKKAAGQLASSPFGKFAKLGRAMQSKVPQEQRLVDQYLTWIGAVSAIQLPIFEAILSEELIPKFQRNVLQYYPDIAQSAADQAAEFNGRPGYGRGTMHAALWRASGEPVAYPALPVVDPTVDTSYLEKAQQQRETWAYNYLEQWNTVMMAFFERFAKMCQFGGTHGYYNGLWRGFTCGQLEKLLEEYPDTNLPMQIIEIQDDESGQKAYLDTYLTFVGVAYWGRPLASAPKLLKNPIAGDVLTAYAQARVFVPTPHLVFRKGGTSTGTSEMGLGGVAGGLPTLPLSPITVTTSDAIVYEGVPVDWTLFNQHWVCQLVPGNAAALAAILQTAPPSVPELADKTLPSLGNVSSEEIETISLH
jgi:hypothetical protein